MSAISPETPGPTPNAERLEWQGQKWEYLTVEYLVSHLRVLGRVEGGIFKGYKEKIPTAEHYNKQFIKEHGAERDLSVAEGLNLLGQDGWELVAATPTARMDGTGIPLLFFKRPKVSP